VKCKEELAFAEIFGKKEMLLIDTLQEPTKIGDMKFIIKKVRPIATEEENIHLLLIHTKFTPMVGKK
jgi:hypothetical protein